MASRESRAIVTRGPVSQRFSSDNAYVRVGRAEMFSADEQALILRFANEISLDIGELDLRGLRAVRDGARAFRRQFLERQWNPA